MVISDWSKNIFTYKDMIYFGECFISTPSKIVTIIAPEYCVIQPTLFHPGHDQFCKIFFLARPGPVLHVVFLQNAIEVSCNCKETVMIRWKYFDLLLIEIFPFIDGIRKKGFCSFMIVWRIQVCAIQIFVVSNFSICENVSTLGICLKCNCYCF